MAGDTGTSAENDDLRKAVAGEERELHDAPSLAQDGARIRRDSDSGPTADTLLTSWEILEAEQLGPRLRSLQADDKDDKPEE